MVEKITILLLMKCHYVISRNARPLINHLKAAYESGFIILMVGCGGLTGRTVPDKELDLAEIQTRVTSVSENIFPFVGEKALLCVPLISQ